jgi:hypothetical protein
MFYIYLIFVYLRKQKTDPRPRSLRDTPWWWKNKAEGGRRPDRRADKAEGGRKHKAEKAERS